MRITLSSIIVEDQEHALTFYRDVLGFIEKQNIPVVVTLVQQDVAGIETGAAEGTAAKGDVPAGGARWITLAAPDAPDGARISLEPAGYPFVRAYQHALKENGIPLTAFAVGDLDGEYARLTAAGVAFTSSPTKGDATMPKMATFDDSCGNWILLYEEPA